MGSTGTAERARRPRVLVVEDEPQIYACLEAALADEGYDVAWAAHGGIALGTIPHFLPDVIVLDLLMPVMDGEAFLAAYRAMPDPQVPVILLTASTVSHRRIDVLGPDATLKKPYLLDDVLASIESCLAVGVRTPAKQPTEARHAA